MDPNTMMMLGAGAVAGLAAGFAAGFAIGRKAKGGAQLQQRRGWQDGRRRQQRPAPAPATGPVKKTENGYEIYVGNLNYDMTEDQLNAEFSAFGKVNSARIITNRHNNKSKGFAFVAMPDLAEAERAVAALHDKEILGRRLRVNIARHPAETAPEAGE